MKQKQHLLFALFVALLFFLAACVEERKAYYSDGVLKEITTYRKGVKDGPYISYYRDGKKQNIKMTSKMEFGENCTKMGAWHLKVFIMQGCATVSGNGGIAMDNCRKKSSIKVKFIVIGCRIVEKFRTAKKTLFVIA